jgi:hypothetical protein
MPDRRRHRPRSTPSSWAACPAAQITLIAIGAALLAATATVLLDRARMARKAHATTA